MEVCLDVDQLDAKVVGPRDEARAGAPRDRRHDALALVQDDALLLAEPAPPDTIGIIIIVTIIIIPTIVIDIVIIVSTVI